MGIETRDLAPGIIIGVLQAPIVVLAPHPIHHRDLAAIHVQNSIINSKGKADQGLGLRETLLVQIARQQENRLLMARKPKSPGQDVLTGGDGPGQAAPVQPGVPHEDKETIRREGALLE